MLLIFASFLLPILWVLLASFDPHAGQIIKLPTEPTFENYLSVFSDPSNIRGFVNSLAISGLQSIVVVLFSFLAAYPLSRYKLSWKKRFLYVIVFMTSLPLNAILVPVFKLFVNFGIQNSLVSTSLFMAAANLPYGIWMMKNFMDAVPVSLEEAAWVDGVGTFDTMRHIIVPLMVPGLSTVLIYVFTNAWGNFFVPFILLQDSAKYPASVRIYQYFQYSGLVEYGKLAAYSVVYIIPCIFLYGFTQKYMSKGFTLGGADR
ncbi:MAG TPA: carbohydrate ABC transporter permease [Rectinemataceae bacterium]|nr:carbohydrate ABC transporter permease [Rectinemataceae bacterium]